jgi:plastocyanin
MVLAISLQMKIYYEEVNLRRNHLMGFTKALALVSALLMTVALLLTSVSMAAYGLDTDMSASGSNNGNNEFLIVMTVTPESVEITAGDSVTWRNLQRPKMPFVLISDDGLWDDQIIYYGKIFSYTFEEPGVYTFSIQDKPEMTGTIIVSEKNLQSVVEMPDEEDVMLPEPEVLTVMPQPGEQNQATMHERVTDRNNEFLIVRTLTPDSMEVYAGEMVTWQNLQRPKMPIVLVSDDRLWDDQTIYYGRIFSFTFDEPGTYSFSVQDHPEMAGTIVVSEKMMASVEDEETDDVIKAPEPSMMEEDAGSQTQVSEREQTMEQNNEFLIIRVATPTSMEIKAGDTVTWRNLQRPKMSLVLISDDGLWDDQTVYYGKAFSYTFEEAGTYRFSVQDNPAIAGTIVVT